MPDYPNYPKLPSVEKHRRLANTEAGQTWQAKKEYGRAVLAAINSLNRAASQKALTPVSCHCASKTWHSEGRDILKAVNAQNLAKLARMAKEDFTHRGGAAHYAKLYEEHMMRQRKERAKEISLPLAA